MKKTIATEIPSAITKPIVEVYWAKDHQTPYIIGFSGQFLHIDEIQDEVDDEEASDRYSESGTYLFRASFTTPQIGDLGRVEVPGYWDLQLIKFIGDDAPNKETDA